MSQAPPTRRPRAVVDPGVLISSLISSESPPARIVDAWLDGSFDLVVSPMLLDEFDAVIRRPKFHRLWPADRLEALRAAIDRRAVNAADPLAQPGLTPDPDDDYLAALAIAVGATHLVTGDKALLDWSPPAGLEVVTPRQFIDVLSF